MFNGPTFTELVQVRNVPKSILETVVVGNFFTGSSRHQTDKGTNSNNDDDDDQKKKRRK